MKETDFYFTLSEQDANRVFAIRRLQGRGDLTVNLFAQLLLERELHRHFPTPPQFDGNGKLLNPDDYRE